MSKRLFTARQLNAFNTTGSWSYSYSGNLVSFVKTPNADTTTLSFEFERDLSTADGNTGITRVSINYVVATASLSSAPTATVNKVTIDPSTRVVSRSAVTQAITFSGTNTVGTAAGTYTADITFDQSAITFGEAFTVEITFVAAATTALSVNGAELNYA
jgi:hypothetical protein